MISGIWSIPSFMYMLSPFSIFTFPFFSNSSNTDVICAPINTDMMAGGASFAPRRKSLPGVAMLARNKSECSWTALMVVMKNVKKSKLSRAELVGANKFTPVSVINDQLLCLPFPFNPAKGFSCKRILRLCFSPTRLMTSIINWLWSLATFTSSNNGATSN